jgi:sugar transferase (PEP-CTERM system associated)
MNSYPLLVIGDALISALAVYTGSMLRYQTVEGLGLLKLSIFVAVTVFVSYLAELYNLEKRTPKMEHFLRVVLGLIGSFIALTSIFYLVNVTLLFRGMFAAALLVFGLFQFLWHAGYRAIMNSSHLACKVLVLGTGPLAKKIGKLITSSNHQHMLCGYLNPTNEPIAVPADAIIGNGSGLHKTVKKVKAHKVVISLTERRGTFPLQDVLNCKFSGIEVVDAPSFYEDLTGKLLIENINPSWFIFSDGFKLNSTIRFYKRTLDIMGALIGLALTLPFLPLIALLIKMDSRGPVFLRQVRVGEMDKDFVLYKFRTMRQDAEYTTGAVWAQANDPRVTRLGWFLRKARIDELPQLYNVLKGEMSFIGPRPERPEFVGKLKTVVPYYSERHFVKPGITGWAQIRYPYGASAEDALEKLRYDLYYIKNMSFFLEMTIVLETIKVMLFGRGAR